MIGFKKNLLIRLLIMALLSPLGILVPMMCHAGGAWAEWDAQTLQQLVGYVPEGFKRYTDIWKPFIPDYNVFGEHSGIIVQAFSYLLAGMVGVILVSLALYALSQLVRK